jgi:4-amino-4-deoxy-L-arabinose transferase-like glycosyltransferase
MTPKSLLYVICTVYLVLAALYSLTTPIFEASDELWHYPTVKFMADNGLALPQPDPAQPWRQQGGQPPLYYMVAAVLTSWIDTSDMPEVRRINPHADIGVVRPDGNANMVVHRAAAEAFPWQGTKLAVQVARFFSIALGLGTVIVTYALAREIFPDWHLVALGAAALTALLPMFLFISGSVNNDNLSNFLGNLLILLLVRLLKASSAPHWRTYVLLGMATGAGLLSKLSVGFIVPLIALALLIVSLRLRDWQPFIVGGVISGGLTILIAGGWYWRNFHLYGDPTGLNAFLDTVGRRLVPANLQQVWAERHSFTQAYWGFFGGVNVPFPDAVYTIFNLIGAAVWVSVVVFGAVNALRYVRSRGGSRTAPTGALRHESTSSVGAQHAVPLQPTTAPYHTPLLLPAAFTLLWILITFISYLRWTAETPASQGRLMFVALSSLSLWMTVGLLWWLPRRAQPFVLMLAAGWFGAASMFGALGVIRPAYTPPPVIEANEARAVFRSSADETGALALLDAQMLTVEAHPDDYIHFTADFLAVEPLRRDWSLFVHLTTDEGVIMTQRDIYPGGGLLATSDMAAGFAWRNPVAVRVPPGAYTPMTVAVNIGWYHLTTGERLTLPDGGQTVVIGQLDLIPRASNLDLPNPLAVNFDNQLELVGYALGDLTPAAGSDVTLTLYWRALRPIEKNYSVFAHIIDPRSFTIYAGKDSYPADTPTATWQPGEIIEDVRVLPVRADTPPDIYELEVGLYSQEADDSFPRLRIVTADGGMADNWFYLSRVRVLPAESE